MVICGPAGTAIATATYPRPTSVPEGLDDAGRLLLQRDDTSPPPLWADEHGLVPAVDEPATFPRRLGEDIDVHPSGAFTFVGRPPEGGPDGVYAVVDRRVRRVAAVGVTQMNTDGHG